MDRILILGGRPLSGRVRVSGAKNAVLKLMAAALLAEEPCVIRNVPDIADVASMLRLLQALGADVKFSPGPEGGALVIDASGPIRAEAPECFVREIRASIQMMGPLLGRLGQVEVGFPGGCAIGDRPIDLHLKGFRRLGATIREQRGMIIARAQRLVGAELHLDFPSVGATENLMSAAVLASGETVIRNPAREPEVVELQNFLNLMGADVQGAGHDVIRIRGVRRLHGAEYTVMPDRVEAGTYMVAAAITGGEVEVAPVIVDHVEMVLGKLREAGAMIERSGQAVFVGRKGPIGPLEIRSAPYPGFPTDMQPQFTSLLSIALGTSLIRETIYTSRFKHVEELRRMGAQIVVEDRTAIIRGLPALSGAPVTAYDLRGGAALLLAGLAAEGETLIEGVHHLDRGYERMEEKLRALGAEVRRLQESYVA